MVGFIVIVRCRRVDAMHDAEKARIREDGGRFDIGSEKVN